MILALLAALVGTAGYGLGSVLQAMAVGRSSGAAVVRHPAYAAGLCLDALAWLSSLVALRVLPLFVVQSLLAGSLGVTVLLARIFLGSRLRRRDMVAVAVTVAALAGVASSAGAHSNQGTPSWFAPAALLGLALAVAATYALYHRGNAALLAITAGAAFSGSALCARALHDTTTWVELIKEPTAWAILAYGLIGVTTYTMSLERGSVGSATAILWVVEVVLPGAAGLLFLGDSIRSGWQLPAAISVGAAVLACTVLAWSPAQHPTTTGSSS